MISFYGFHHKKESPTPRKCKALLRGRKPVAAIATSKDCASCEVLLTQSVWITVNMNEHRVSAEVARLATSRDETTPLHTRCIRQMRFRFSHIGPYLFLRLIMAKRSSHRAVPSAANQWTSHATFIRIIAYIKYLSSTKSPPHKGGF